MSKTKNIKTRVLHKQPEWQQVKNSDRHVLVTVNSTLIAVQLAPQSPDADGTWPRNVLLVEQDVSPGCLWRMYDEQLLEVELVVHVSLFI